MRRRPPIATRTDTLFPYRRSSDLPAAYLQRIARNLLADRARNRHAREAFVPLEDWDAEAAPEQENALVASDTLRLYEAPIAGLPERKRRSEEPTSEIKSLQRRSYAGI